VGVEGVKGASSGCAYPPQACLHVSTLSENTLVLLLRGVEWSGVEWSGVEWSGVEWSGVGEALHLAALTECLMVVAEA
jgi:hypothetical protein